MTRHNVPGDSGWFELRDIKELTEDHQLEYLDFLDGLRDQKRQALAALNANPAVMANPADDTPVDLTHQELIPANNLVEGWVITDSSFGIPRPRPLPLIAGNVLRQAMSPYYRALNGVVPKESPGSDSTSTATSAENATAPPAP